MEKNKDCSCRCGSSNIFQTVLLIILVIFSAFQIAFMMGLTPNFNKTSDNNSTGMEKVIREALLQHEYSKVGGKENYDVITELQGLIYNNPDSGQDRTAMQAMINSLKGGDTTAQQEIQQQADTSVNSATATATAFNSLSEERRESVLKNAVIEGSSDADIVVVEYSDMECPFCLSHVNENQVAKQLKAEFGDKLAFVFKNHFGVEHRGTRKKAYGAICAARLGGVEKYTQFYSGIFAYSGENEGYYPVSKLSDYAKEIGLDVAKWEECIDDESVIAQFEAERQEAIDFGLRGTPGVLLFNNKTGAYTTISGAYPYEHFQAAVKSLLQ